MAAVKVQNFSISLDGFGTGEGLTFDEPFGHAGQRLHEWMIDTAFGRPIIGQTGGSTGIDHTFASQHEHGIGAEIMGRGKFVPSSEAWTADWRGWWGDNPPFHTPVFVLTHHPRPSLEMEGGTTFHFVDVSPPEAVAMATEAAGGLDVRLGGGPSVVRDFLAEGLVDHAHFVVVPIVLGRGVRVWDGLEALEDRYAVESVSSPSGVVHLTLTKRT